MRVSVVVRQEKLRHAVVSFVDIRNLETEPRQIPSRFVNVGRRPVKPNAFKVVRLFSRADALIEHERQFAFAEQAVDEPALVRAHFIIHFEPKAIHPQPQARFQIGTGYDRHARFDTHSGPLKLKIASHVMPSREAERHYSVE